MNLIPSAVRRWIDSLKFANPGGDLALAQRDANPQGAWTGPLSGIEPRKIDPHVYEALRESIGVLDAAIAATVVLDGIVSVRGGNDKLVDEIQDFMRFVPVNDAETGLQALYESQGNERYEQGFGIAEWFTDKAGSDIAGLRVADSKGVIFVRGERGLETWYRPVAIRTGTASGLENVERLLRNSTMRIDTNGLMHHGYTRLDPARLLYTVNQPEADGPYGTSLLRSLEFNGRTLLTIQNAIDRTWTRYGDPPLLAVYKVANRKVLDTAGELEKRQKAIADKLRQTMEAKAAGNSVDMVQAIGKEDDFKLDVIGAGGVVLEVEMPAKHLLEQVVAKTQLPPWMLGLQFSTSERMAEQQAGIALQAAKTRWVRRHPGLHNLVATMLRLRGRTWKPGDWELYHELPNIQDALKQAQAEFLMAQTAMMRREAGAAPANDVSRETAQGIDNNLRGARPRERRSHGCGHEHHKAAGEDGEPWADADPQLPVIERGAVAALIRLWGALREALQKALGIEETSNEPWRWEATHAIGAGLAEADFLRAAAAESGPLSDALVAVWKRAVQNAAEQVGAETPLSKFTANVALALRNQGMRQVRTTTFRVYRAEIVEVLAAGALDGLPAAAIARELRQRFGAADYDWGMLVSSELVGAYGPAKLDEFALNGVERYDFSTAGDESVCPICAGHRDGGPYLIGQGPLPMRDTHPLCRCAVVPAPWPAGGNTRGRKLHQRRRDSRRTLGVRRRHPETPCEPRPDHARSRRDARNRPHGSAGADRGGRPAGRNGRDGQRLGQGAGMAGGGLRRPARHQPGRLAQSPHQTRRAARADQVRRRRQRVGQEVPLMSHNKALAIAQRPAAKATDAQLAQINTFTLRAFSAEELMVREYVVAHNCIDRDRECFDEALLQDFARTAPGKGVFIRHPGGWDGDSGPGEGRVFEARLQSMSLDEARTLMREPTLTLPPDRTLVTVLFASAYYVRTSENDALLTKMDAGIVSDVSIGFNASDRTRIKGSDGIELDAFRWLGPGETLEISNVWLGAQPGARAIKSSKPNPPEEPAAMSDTKDPTGADALKALQPKAAQFDAIKQALGADAELADDATRLASLVAAGKAYRHSLIDTIVKAERLGGGIGDTDAEVEQARKEFDALPLRSLKFMAGKAAGGIEDNAAPRLQGGDPNAAKPNTVKDATTATTPTLVAAMI